MKKSFFYALFAFIISTSALNAQESLHDEAMDKEYIKQTIHNYFEGWMTGDTVKLGKAMHKTCHLKFVRDNEVAVITRKDYLSRFKPKPKSENTTGRIIQMDVTRTAASAKCEIERPDRLFTDYFNLLKIDGRWYIVDKISTSISKE